MLRITKEESELLVRCQKGTARIWNTGNTGGRTSLPYVFTEKGIYMLMTVLRGERAIKQSIALIRLFQAMKDYITKSNNLVTTNEVLKLSRQVDSNTREIKKIKNDLKDVMDNFINPSTYKHFVIFNGEKVDANEVYRTIYSLAKESIIIIDDYISPKTLEHLKVVNKMVGITLLSDNVSNSKITENDLNDYYFDTGITISLFPTNNIIHDRYIILNYKTENEMMFNCGPSEKDAGHKLGTIQRNEYPKLYHPIIDELLKK